MNLRAPSARFEGAGGAADPGRLRMWHDRIVVSWMILVFVVIAVAFSAALAAPEK